MPYSDLIRQMTLTEKALLLTGKNLWETQAIPRLGVPAVVMSDGSYGLRREMPGQEKKLKRRCHPATCFPVGAALGSSWDVQLMQRVGEALGAEAAALDVDILLGPGMNVKRTPLCGRSFEYYSEDPYLTGKLAAAMIRGIQSRGVLACPKHFACNSQEDGRMANDAIVDEKTLREIYLTAFEIAVREGRPGALMTSYNLVNGTYAGEHPHLLGDILRGEWGYEGMVVSDWGAGVHHVEAVRAGATLDMPGPGAADVCALIEAVKSGALPEETLDRRVEELLRVAMREKPARRNVDFPAHHALARQAAAESIVLLKNDGGLLPLRAGQRVAVIGDFARAPRYQGAGSAKVVPTKLETPLDCLRQSGLNVTGYARGFERLDRENEALLGEAAELARNADVALVYLGLSENEEAEGLDRTTLALPKNQLRLLAALAETKTPVAVVLTCGCAVDVRWRDLCSALLYDPLCGQAGALAMADILSGKVCPSGRLAESFPLREEYLPARPQSLRRTVFREGPYVGYRYYATANVPTAYPFGYGLSYTDFALERLEVEEARARCTVRNAGKRRGAAVVQLYISRPDLPGPARELRGFARVELEAGESRAVVLPLGRDAFCAYDPTRGEWVVYAGRCVVAVGFSSEDIRLRGEVQLDGVAPDPAALDALPGPYRTGAVKEITDADFAQILGHPLPADARTAMSTESMFCELRDARGWLIRLFCRWLDGQLERSRQNCAPNLSLLYLWHLPLHAIARSAGAFAAPAMSDDILLAAQGHQLRAVGRLLRGFLCVRKQDRALRAALKADGKRKG